jgi:hypothetical protein
MKSAYEALMGYTSIRQKWLRIFMGEGGKNYGYGKLATDGMGTTAVSIDIYRVTVDKFQGFHLCIVQRIVLLATL